MVITLYTNIVIFSPNNPKNYHWTSRYATSKSQKQILTGHWLSNPDTKKITLPCHVTLIRQSPKSFDHDNYIAGCKAVRDCIADLLIPGLAPGQADGDSRISWSYKQEAKHKSQKLIIQIECDQQRKNGSENNNCET